MGQKDCAAKEKAAYPCVLKCPRHKVRIGKGQAELALAEDDKKNNKRRFSHIDEREKRRGEMELVCRGWGTD